MQCTNLVEVLHVGEASSVLTLNLYCPKEGKGATVSISLSPEELTQVTETINEVMGATNVN